MIIHSNLKLYSQITELQVVNSNSNIIVVLPSFLDVYMLNGVFPSHGLWGIYESVTVLCNFSKIVWPFFYLILNKNLQE